jgi:inner membrane protein
MMSALNTLEPHWMWLIVGVVLGTAEIVAPGFFLIWLAGAAIVTGLAALVLPISMTVQIALFSILSVAAVYAGRHWFARNPIQSDDPNLNNRAARLVGEIVTVVEPIEHGIGRVKLGDGVWTAKGADADIGARLRVTGLDGSAVKVDVI